MSRYNRTFTWDRDESTGEYGWIPEWLNGVESPYAMRGEGTAHDTLEHEAHESDGNLENEVRALGAVYFVRGESGWFAKDPHRGNTDPEYYIATDFIELFRAFEDGDSLGFVTERLADPLDMLPIFRSIVRAGIRTAIAEYRRNGAESRPALAEFAGARRWLESLMLAGYYAASGRFGGNCYNACYLFERIAEATEAAAEYAEDNGAMRLIIDVDTLASKFRAVCEIYENPVFGDHDL